MNSDLIFNHTSHSTTKLKGLLEFVVSSMNLRKEPEVAFWDLHSNGTSTGVAYEDRQWDRYVVVLHIAKNDSFRYPHLQRYVEELPHIGVANWEEEVLLVLAHEMRHIYQYQNDMYPEPADRTPKAVYALEVDAETFAYDILYAWRIHREFCQALAA